MDTIALLSLLSGLACGSSAADLLARSSDPVARLARPVRLSERGRGTASAWLETIAVQARLPAVFDGSVTDAVRHRRLTLEAEHLNGYEALACLARMIGMEVVVFPGVAVIAAPERIPSGWRAMAARQHRYWHEQRQDTTDGWIPRLARRAGLQFADVTLAAALRNVSRAYRTDVLASAELWEAQELVSIEGHGLPLNTVLTRLGEQLGAVVRCRDGAAWLERIPKRTGSATDRGGAGVEVVTPPPRPVSRRPVASRLERRLRLPIAKRSHEETLAAIAERAAVSIRGTPQSETARPGLEISGAAGRLGDVLEAARMIWRRPWRVSESPADEGWTLTLSSPPED